MKFHLTKKSTNKKTGLIPVSTSPMDTCPSHCPFKDKGCYADGGPLLIHWRKITKGERGVEWRDFLQQIEDLPSGQLWRHNQAGDLLPYKNNKSQIHMTALNMLCKANHGKKGFTYTHYRVEGEDGTADHNRDLIYTANLWGFTINLSANDLAHADRLAKLDIAPVTTLLPSHTANSPNIYTYTPEGRKIMLCPATRTNTNCAKCKLCANPERTVIIGFPAHGFKKNNINRFIQIMEDI